MNKDQFTNLSPMDKLSVLARNIKSVKNPATVFGPDAKTAKIAHRKLAKALHPDVIDGDEDDDIANDAFSTMEKLWSSIKDAVNSDDYDGSVPTEEYAGTIDYRKQTYNLIYITEGDAGDYYALEGTRMIVHIARSPKDNALYENEATVVKGLNQSQFYEELKAFHLVPELITSMNVGGNKANLFQFKEFGNILAPPHFYTLNQLAHHYKKMGKPFQIKKIGWLWSRLNDFISFISMNGIVHAGITPDSILIEPTQHIVIVMNYLHSSIKESPYKSFSKSWRSELYPPEFAKGVRVHPSLDVYMAAKSILWAYKVADTTLPNPIIKYFQGCTAHSPNTRLNDGESRYSRWKEGILMDQLGWPSEFVRTDINPEEISRDFADYNDEIDWSWWWC